MGNQSAPKLRSLPVQVIHSRDGVILKRGCCELKVAGEGAAEFLETILSATAGQGSTIEEIHACFRPSDRATVSHLVGELEVRRIVISSDTQEGGSESGKPESHLDVFYWHFNVSTAQAAETLNRRSIVIVGVNHVSRRLVASLESSGFKGVRVVDYPALRNLRFFDDSGRLLTDPSVAFPTPPLSYERWADMSDSSDSFECLVATSDFGGLELMRPWNAFCIESRRHFLPVVLQDMIGYIGPLVIPGETACFECLSLRQNSHLTDPRSERVAESCAFEGQTIAGYLLPMASVLGDIACVELIKFYGPGLPLWRVGRLIEVNLLAGRLESRNVLKVPRCPACSPLLARSQVSVLKDLVNFDGVAGG